MMNNSSGDHQQLLVTRFHGEDNHYLSFVAEFTEKEGSLNLSFYHKRCVINGNSCGGLLYLDDYNGNIVVCNPTTKELRFLPPSAGIQRSPGTSYTIFNATSFGYDSNSDDYKLVRFITHTYEGDETEDGRSPILGYAKQVELYSFKSNSWKEIYISNPAAAGGIIVSREDFAYASGRSYWTVAAVNSIQSSTHVLSFDFADESFDCFCLPPKPTGGYLYKLVEFHGSLGAIGYDMPRDSRNDHFCVRSRIRAGNYEKQKVLEKSRCGVYKRIGIWVRREGLWGKAFDVSVCDVERPLGLRDGRYLFLEETTCSSDDLTHLLVYDCVTKDFKKLDIKDYPGQMMIFSYVESTVSLSPNSHA